MGGSLRSVTRALISVSDKTGLEDFARRLNALGVELVSTGGSHKAIAAAGLAVREAADLTGFPEMLDGRVKTLHPGVHAGLLYRRDDPAHAAAMAEHGLAAIDLIYVNLYPFEATVRAGAEEADCIENIDIGGPAMIRAAAKNHAHVAVIVDPADMDTTLAALEQHGGLEPAFLRALAAKAYARTAAYDAAVSRWFAESAGDPAPQTYVAFGGGPARTLRYGENPHQRGWFVPSLEPRPGAATAEIVQGKELSYNNIQDADAAFELVSEFPPVASGPAVAIIKHANPCGVALGPDLAEAYRRAKACDPVSAFGGVIALNGVIDGPTAEAITEIFTEVVIAPGADDDARRVFAAKKNLRLLLTGGLADPAAPGLAAKTVSGGLLVQDRDAGRLAAADLRIVTKAQPSDAQIGDMLFAWTVAKHVKSNAIVYARNGQTAGIGAGQMSRLDSARTAARKALDAQASAGWAEPMTKGCACASDAFFPFPDGLLQAAEAGASCVVQPGGSVKDDEVIAAADAAGLVMAFTGMRHFRH